MNLGKIAAAALCAVMALPFCGCGGDESSQEIYYGQAYKEVEAGDIYRIYDGRFLTDEEVDAVAHYFYSIQTEDYELYASTQPKAYLDYDKKYSGIEPEDRPAILHDYVAQSLGGEFEYTQIEITNCSGADDDITENLDSIYEDAGAEKKFSETVKEKKLIEYSLTAVLQDDETASEYTSDGQLLYIFDCEDGIYIFEY